MTTPTAKSAQPSLAALTMRYVSESERSADFESSVEPHEVQSAFATEPKAAWHEAIAAAKLLGITESLAMPGDWSAYVRQVASADFLPLCLGHFPQQVSDVTNLISGTRAKKNHTEARSWTSKTPKPSAMNLLLGAAAARVAGQTAEVEKLLQQAEQLADTVALENLVETERAAAYWATGDLAKARTIWSKYSTTAPGAFNLGIAAMTAKNKVEARTHFGIAVKQLPETSGWHHLAKLYLALAQV